jgi:hypothetical protein
MFGRSQLCAKAGNLSESETLGAAVVEAEQRMFDEQGSLDISFTFPFSAREKVGLERFSYRRLLRFSAMVTALWRQSAELFLDQMREGIIRE